MQNLIYIIQYYLYNSKNQIETQRLTDKWFTKNKLITEWHEYNEYFIDREKLYKFLIENNLQQETFGHQHNNICKLCGNTTKFLGLKHGYLRYCSRSCASKDTLNLEKQKETMLERYGVENAFQMENTRKNCNSEEAKAKKKITFKETMLERYGVETVLMLPEYRNDHLRNYSEIVNKFKETNLRKYGYMCTLNIPETRATIRKNKELNYEWIPLNQYEYFKLYKYWVWKYTNKQDFNKIENYNLRGRNDIVENAHHIDHKYSIFQGFVDNIPPYIIGNICNLEMLYYKNNISKGKKCSITKEELISSFYND